MENDRVSNLYSIKIVNKKREDLPLQLKVQGAEVQIVGRDLFIPAGELIDGEFFVIFPEHEIKKRKSDLILELYSGEHLLHKEPFIFIGPSNNKNSEHH